MEDAIFYQYMMRVYIDTIIILIATATVENMIIKVTWCAQMIHNNIHGQSKGV